MEQIKAEKEQNEKEAEVHIDFIFLKCRPLSWLWRVFVLGRRLDRILVFQIGFRVWFLNLVQSLWLVLLGFVICTIRVCDLYY